MNKKNIYKISTPGGKHYFPPKGSSWRYSKDKFETLVEDNRIWFGKKGNNSPCPKIFLNEVREGLVATSWWNHQEAGHYQQSMRDMRDLMTEAVFPFPKPIKLITRLLKISTQSNDLILDFFAGSGTTGDAVMQLNAEDGGNRKFILVQWDEKIDKKKNTEAHKFCTDNGFEPVISSICIERLNRAGEKLKTEIETQNNGKLFDEKELPDIGYKVYSLEKKPQVIGDRGKQKFFSCRKQP